MPTGYTAGILSNISFEEFVLRCARNFGACITMRDDDLNVRIPEEFKPSTEYYDKKLKRAEEEYEKIRCVDVRVLKEQMDCELNKLIKDKTNREKENRENTKKYQDMLEKVQSWCPPSSDHAELKKFMINQIIMSLEQEKITDYWEIQIKNFPATVIEWREAKINELQETMVYCRKNIAKEIELTKNRNLWIKQLRESLNKTTESNIKRSIEI